MKRFDLDQDDLEYELQFAEDDSYRNNKKSKRAHRASGRNWKHAWLDNQGDTDNERRYR
jgi:hypothetical protein